MLEIVFEKTNDMNGIVSTKYCSKSLKIIKFLLNALYKIMFTVLQVPTINVYETILNTINMSMC